MEEESLSQSFTRVVTLKKRHGKCGSYTHNDGSHYIGDFDENGVKCGLGHMEAPNGAIYDGQFHKGLPNGVGIMRFPDSSKYEGEFMQGWFHGHGVYCTVGGMKFEGEFRGGRIWGNGLLTFNDGKNGAEGYFQDTRFSRDGCAKSDIKKARKVANFARRVCSETSYDVSVDWKTEEQELKEVEDGEKKEEEEEQEEDKETAEVKDEQEDEEGKKEEEKEETSKENGDE